MLTLLSPFLLQTEAVVAGGALPGIIRLIQSPSDECRNQALWAIGNIAGDGSSTRDACLAAGATTAIIELLAVESGLVDIAASPLPSHDVTP